MPLVKSNFQYPPFTIYLEQGKDIDLHREGQSIGEISGDRLDRVMKTGADAALEPLVSDIARQFGEEFDQKGREGLYAVLRSWRRENYGT